MKKGKNCWKQHVPTGTLLISEESEFDLTRERIYVCIDYVGPDLIEVKNDKGVVDTYSTEYFRFYNGETIDGFTHYE